MQNKLFLLLFLILVYFESYSQNICNDTIYFKSLTTNTLITLSNNNNTLNNKIKKITISNKSNIKIDTFKLVKTNRFKTIYLITDLQDSNFKFAKNSRIPIIYLYNHSNNTIRQYVFKTNKYGHVIENGLNYLYDKTKKATDSNPALILLHNINNKNILNSICNKFSNKSNVIVIAYNSLCKKNNKTLNDLSSSKININMLLKKLKIHRISLNLSLTTYNNLPNEETDTLYIISDTISKKIIQIKFFNQSIKNFLAEKYIDTANIYFRQGKHTLAFNILTDNKSKAISEDTILFFYKKYYARGITNAYNNKTLLDYFKFSEKKWHADTMNFINYDSLKQFYLIKTWKDLNKAEADKKLQLQYLEQLPNKTKYLPEIYILKGDILLQKNKLNEAFNYYVKSYKITKSKYRLKKINNLALKIFQKNCNKNSRKLLWKNYKLLKYNKKILTETFELKYYSACTYYKLSFYDKAFENYLWMKKNFKNNNSLITFKEIEQKLNDLKIKNCDFTNVIKISQTICYNSDNSDSINEAIKNYIIGLKGIYFKYIIDALQVYINNNDDIFLLKKDIVHNTKYSIFINDVFVFKNNRLHTLKGFLDVDNKKLIHLNSFPVALKGFTNKSDAIFLIQKTRGNTLFGIGYKSISHSKGEMSLISFLKNKLKTTNAWIKLNDFEENVLANEMAYYISVIVQNLNKGKLDKSLLKKYWDLIALNKTNLIQYIVIYDKRGNELINFNFNKNNYKLNKLQWEKSKVTPLFFKQTITSINNENVITDISNPIELATGKAVIKIGIKKIWN